MATGLQNGEFVRGQAWDLLDRRRREWRAGEVLLQTVAVAFQEEGPPAAIGGDAPWSKEMLLRGGISSARMRTALSRVVFRCFSSSGIQGKERFVLHGGIGNTRVAHDDPVDLGAQFLADLE